MFKRNKDKSGMQTVKSARGKIIGSSGMVTSKKASDIIIDVIIYAVLVLILFICIIPLWHVVMSSVSDPKKIAFGVGQVGGIVWWPVGDVTFAGYEYIFEDGSIFTGYLNTIIYMLAATLLGMIINVTGGYVISRKTKSKTILTLFVMFTAIFSGGMLPTYAVIKGLGMTDTRWALIIPGCTNAFFIVMLANAFNTVPESTIESAQLDGAGHLRIMWQILLPQALPFAIVVILNSLVLQWNSWVSASLYLSSNSSDLYPLQIIVREITAISDQFMLAGGGGVADYDLYLLRYAVVIVGSLPMLIVFPFFQKKMETNVVAGAVKG